MSSSISSPPSVPSPDTGMPNPGVPGTGVSNASGTTPEGNDTGVLTKLREQLLTGTEKAQKQALQGLRELQAVGWPVLQEFLLASQGQPLRWPAGSAYQILSAVEDTGVQRFLQEQFPQGLVPLISERGIDYSSVQAALVRMDYEEADRQTLFKLCDLAGEAAIRRKWIYFSEVRLFPVADLQTLDRLWQLYSEERFGFSLQRQLWLSVGQNWDKLWPLIGWKSDNTWTRYPGAFIWNLSAPKGHLPLTNQLRGVRVMDALMNHPAFTEGE